MILLSADVDCTAAGARAAQAAACSSRADNQCSRHASSSNSSSHSSPTGEIHYLHTAASVGRDMRVCRCSCTLRNHHASSESTYVICVVHTLGDRDRHLQSLSQHYCTSLQKSQQVAIASTRLLPLTRILLCRQCTLLAQTQQQVYLDLSHTSDLD